MQVYEFFMSFTKKWLPSSLNGVSTTSNVNTIVLACYVARVTIASYLRSQFIDSGGYIMVGFVVSICPI